MNKQELIDKTDETITDLVVDKDELLKAYNYYNGIRDAELFRYLEENFGIGSPTSVEFTPLLKKHVDALVGEYLGTPILPKISCKDATTISNISREKLLKISNEIIKFLKEHLSNFLLGIITGKDSTDTLVKKLIDLIIEDIDLSFISQYEIAALNIVEYIMLSRDTDIVTKLRLLLTDLLISGYTFFKTYESFNGTNIKIKVCDPRNTFFDRNPESPYVRDSYRSVVREWLTKDLILAIYGKELSKSDIKTVKETWDGSSSLYARAYLEVVDAYPDYDEEIEPGYPSADYNGYRTLLIPVYEVEWLETDENFVMQRYTTIRIGDNIYVLRGLDKNVVRSLDNPNLCRISLNGVYFLNRAQLPYSLILKCMSLLDRYDLLNYYRDRLIANSGVAGTIMDMSLIPGNLGVDWPERIQKWLAYKKAGIEWIDTTLEGRNENGNAPMNTIFNGYDDTLKALAVQAIELAILSVESTVSSITGVFRERLNGIELRDAVTNIKLGVQNSFIVTKHYFLLMDLITCEILLDCLNLAKITYKKGITGTIILGDKYQRIFTALPEHFTLTDFDMHIISSTDVMLDMQTIKSVLPELIKSLLISPDIIFEALTAKSLTLLKYTVLKSMQKQKEENNQLLLLGLKLEETSLLLLLALKELQLALLKIKLLDESRLQLELLKIQLEYLVNWFKAQTDKTYKDRLMDVEEKRTQIELAQLRDGNPYNDKIRQLM